ncbi:MAG TPA: MaoC/PaaZ C-terminal domain-containing protein [Solirubrobacteraceae bacterium]|nr:MaoC/PaaZ C-terminal domain-containing protein [Solirubrobacteraceae bacterium]
MTLGQANDNGWDLGRLGRWTDPVEFDVKRERIIDFAEATNDEHPLHRSGELAPPVFPVVGALIDVISPEVMAVAPSGLAMRVVHGEHDFRYHRPIVPDTTLVTRGAALGVRPVSTGAVVIGKGITETPRGELVVEQHVAAFFRGAEVDVQAGEGLNDHAFDESVRQGEPWAIVTHAFDDDQTYRYSHASGDLNPIHLDDGVARAVGLPGIIVHGLCTMAFCSRAVVNRFCPDDPTRLRRLAVRFAAVVQPGESVTHRLWRLSPRNELDQIMFESTSGSGSLVIKDGLAEVER